RLTSLHSNNYSINDTSTTALYTLSLHDALPISITLCHPPSVLIAISKVQRSPCHLSARARTFCRVPHCHSEKQSRSSSLQNSSLDRKSTRLNSSHSQISYAVFCLKKKKTHITNC